MGGAVAGSGFSLAGSPQQPPPQVAVVTAPPVLPVTASPSMVGLPAGLPANSLGSPAPAQSSWTSPWKHDVQQMTGYLKDGLPGLEHMGHDALWNVERLS